MEDNVLRLDIPMNDAQTMDLIDRLADLFHHKGNPGLGQRLGLLELMIQLPSCAYLQDDVDIDGITEAAIHLDDIRMIEIHLDLHLSCKLIRNFLLMKQLLLDYLQSTDEVSVSLLHQIHSSVLAVAQLLDLDEVFNTHLPLFGLRGLLAQLELRDLVLMAIYDQAALHVAAVDPAEEGGRLLDHLLTLPSLLRIFDFLEVNLLGSREMVFLPAGMIDGCIFDGFAHPDCSSGHILKEFLFAGRHFFGDLMFLHVGEDQALR